MSKTTPPQVITIVEREDNLFSFDKFPYEYGELLWREYKDKLEIEFPTIKTNNQWLINSKGWVGYIPLTHDFAISLTPKVELSNLFRMLEYAYDLKSFNILEGTFESDSLSDIYERLALILARRILTRLRQGVYRTYIPQIEQLPYIRGQLVISQLVNTPWKVDHHCNYQEHTVDVEENQLLAWTLYLIIHSHICSERSLPILRQAYRGLEGSISLKSFCPEDCINRLYNRLNIDYKPLHGLCRFFLEHSGPQNRIGDHTTLPFLVNMDRLFEKFVTAWLRLHPIHGLAMDDQVKIDITEDGEIFFSIDLVLYDEQTGKTKIVLDTKYKDPETPSADDVQQVVAYAEAKRCTEAVLIYPKSLPKPLNKIIGDIRVRSIPFSISEDLDIAGIHFIGDLSID